MWNITKRVSKPFLNIQYIFPLKQKSIEDFITSNINNPNIEQIIVFGSSITSACNPWSDVDIFVKGDVEYGDIIRPSIDNFDILTSCDLRGFSKEKIFNEIFCKGVVVYER